MMIRANVVACHDHHGVVVSLRERPIFSSLASKSDDFFLRREFNKEAIFFFDVYSFSVFFTICSSLS
jgi:hypothetical protein